MGKRNWTAVAYDSLNHDLVFDIRVELERGAGVTTGFVSCLLTDKHQVDLIVRFAVRAPPPKW
jgi:hypothetical protein